jgi:hypothetical protein
MMQVNICMKEICVVSVLPIKHNLIIIVTPLGELFYYTHFKDEKQSLRFSNLSKVSQIVSHITRT